MNHPFARHRGVAGLTLLLGLLAIAVASGGCEAIVTGSVPNAGCEPSEGACPPGKVCSPAGECVAACPDVPCPDGNTCLNGLCVEAPSNDLDAGPEAAAIDSTLPLPDAQPDTREVDAGNDAPATGDIGEKCAVHANCLSALCGDTSILTDPVIQAAGGPVCTKTCCSSEECPADHVCFGPGGGGNYCVRASLLPRAAEAGTLGTAPGGASCAGASACRSGVCVANKCADACCTHANCGDAGAICRRETVDGHQVHACGDPPVFPIDDNMPCGSSASCASGLCIGSFCRPRCCGQKSCTQNPAFNSTSLCGYVAAQPTTESLTGCFLKAEVGAGNKAVGDTTCTQDTDCKTNLCALGTTRMCTDVCCTDQDCALYPLAKRCRPAASPNPHQLTCQP